MHHRLERSTLALPQIVCKQTADAEHATSCDFASITLHLKQINIQANNRHREARLRTPHAWHLEAPWSAQVASIAGNDPWLERHNVEEVPPALQQPPQCAPQPSGQPSCTNKVIRTTNHKMRRQACGFKVVVQSQAEALRQVTPSSKPANPPS